jgi:hypothetical protein
MNLLGAGGGTIGSGVKLLSLPFEKIVVIIEGE